MTYVLVLMLASQLDGPCTVLASIRLADLLSLGLFDAKPLLKEFTPGMAQSRAEPATPYFPMKLLISQPQELVYGLLRCLGKARRDTEYIS